MREAAYRAVVVAVLFGQDDPREGLERLREVRLLLSIIPPKVFAFSEEHHREIVSQAEKYVSERL